MPEYEKSLTLMLFTGSEFHVSPVDLHSEREDTVKTSVDNTFVLLTRYIHWQKDSCYFSI